MKKLVTILAVSVLSLSAFSQTISWAYLQWAASTTINQGQVFEAGAAVFADGLTNTMNSTTGEGITADLGYSSSNTNPSTTGWTWSPVAFNADWGNNFYYQGSVSGMSSGTYYYTFRFKIGSGAYKYAGTDGLWNGSSSVNGSFAVSSSTAVNELSAEHSIVLLQNPVTNGNVQLKFNDQVDGIYTVRLFDTTGRMHSNILFNSAGSASVIDINVAGYTKGLYYIQVVNPGQKKAAFKVIVD